MSAKPRSRIEAPGRDPRSEVSWQTAVPATAPRFLASGDTALVVEFGDRMDRHLSALVLNLLRRLTEADIAGVVEAVPTFRSLLIHYDPLVVRARELQARLAPLIDGLEAEAMGGHRWFFPTCYEGGDLAPDLDDVARARGLSRAEVVSLHTPSSISSTSSASCRGCPYLGDLPACSRTAAADQPAHQGSCRLGRDRDQSDLHLSAGEPRRMAHHRPHRRAAVRSAAAKSGSARARRYRAVRARRPRRL